MSIQAWDKTGATRTAPAISEIGEGTYRIQSTTTDENTGTIFLIDTGAGNEPRRVTIPCYRPDKINQFWAVCLEDVTGSLWSSAVAPTVGSYRASDGTVLSSPTPNLVTSTYLYSFTPTAGDISSLAKIRIDGPVGSSQPYWFGEVEAIGSGSGSGDISAPVVNVLSPTPGTHVYRDTPVIFDITDNIAIGRVFVVMRFTDADLEEIVHQGDRFSDKYTTSSTRSIIAGGYRYSIIRNGGWFENPILDVYATDSSGLEL